MTVAVAAVEGTAALGLTVDRVGKAFAGVHALENVSFAVPPGELVGLIGPNGSGKTTLFNVVTGVIRDARGSVLIGDHEVRGWAPDRIAALGVARTYQKIRVFPTMTVAENVRVGQFLGARRHMLAALAGSRRARRRLAEHDERADAVLELCGLAAWRNAEAGTLPSGTQKLVEVARALAQQPALLLLDEPAAGLNEQETARLSRLVREVRAAGVTVVIVEHDLEVIFEICEHVVVLDHGRLLFTGTPAQARRSPAVVEAYLGGEDDESAA